MVFELINGGDLVDFIEKFGGIGEDIGRYFFKQILDAVHHIHSNGYCHRNIRPEYIHITFDYIVKLSHFGKATRIEA